MEKISIIIFAVFLIYIGGVFALPVPAPHAFYGEIKCSDGRIINLGNIIAKIDGDIKDTSQIVNGTYGYTDSFVITGNNGDIINFYLNEGIIGNYSFQAFEVTELNFTIACEDAKREEIDFSHGNHFVQFCDTNWKCSGWSECSNGIMTRKCTDTNNCDIEYNKPYEQSGCNGGILSNVYVEKGNTNYFWIIAEIILFIILLIGSITLANFRKNRLSKKK